MITIQVKEKPKKKRESRITEIKETKAKDIDLPLIKEYLDLTNDRLSEIYDILK